jgi:hypothetical protein
MPLKAFKVTSKGIVKYFITPPMEAATPPTMAPKARPNMAKGVKIPQSSLESFFFHFKRSLVFHDLNILKILPKVYVCFFFLVGVFIIFSEPKKMNTV